MKSLALVSKTDFISNRFLMYQQNSPFTAVFVSSLRLPLTATFHFCSSDYSVVDLVTVGTLLLLIGILFHWLLPDQLSHLPHPFLAQRCRCEDCLLDPKPAITSFSFQMSYKLFYFFSLMLPLTITLHLSSSDLVMIYHVAVAVNVPVVVTLVLFVVVFFHQRLASAPWSPASFAPPLPPATS